MEILKPLKKAEKEDALWLLQARLNCTRSQLLLRSQEKIDSKFLRTFRSDWSRRKRGEPLQYIVGSAPFYGREFFVKRGVLIPRPETESLLEFCLQYLKDKPGARVLDIGTGSGILGISLKLEKPDLEVTASDLSLAALSVAKKNSVAMRAELRFLRASFLSSGLEQEDWDLVVSNPPYLDFRKDKIADNVREWEPRMALEPKAIGNSKLKVRVKDKGRVVGKVFGKRNANPQEDLAPLAGLTILEQCSQAKVGATFLELSPRVAMKLERQWKSSPRVKSISRAPDLAGRKRFLLVVWNHG